MYAPAFNALRGSTSELFVLIGTSHYWSDRPLILTEKHFSTPLGLVETDRPLVDRLRMEPGTDLPHKPEHSLELHIVILQHVLQGRPFQILPILVGGIDAEDAAAREHLAQAGRRVREAVDASGKSATWLISGDLAHVGLKFGDETPADAMLLDVNAHDRELVALLEGADIEGYHQVIARDQEAFRVCGHAPTIVALEALRPAWGKLLAYDVWDDRDTQSAVSFATMAFGGNQQTP